MAVVQQLSIILGKKPESHPSKFARLWSRTGVNGRNVLCAATVRNFFASCNSFATWMPFELFYGDIKICAHALILGRDDLPCREQYRGGIGSLSSYTF